jgi:hypothetical protein
VKRDRNRERERGREGGGGEGVNAQNSDKTRNVTRAADQHVAVDQAAQPNKRERNIDSTKRRGRGERKRERERAREGQKSSKIKLTGEPTSTCNHCNQCICVYRWVMTDNAPLLKCSVHGKEDRGYRTKQYATSKVPGKHTQSGRRGVGGIACSAGGNK